MSNTASNQNPISEEEVKREKTLSQQPVDRYGGDSMGKRTVFLLLAFLAGMLFLIGLFSTVLSYLAREFGQRFVLASGAIGVVLVIGGVVILYYLMKEIK